MKITSRASRGWRLWPLLLMTLLVVLSLVSAFFAYRRERTRGEVAALIGDAAAPAGAEQFSGALGVNLEANELASQTLGKTLDWLEGGGVAWIRFTLPWDQIEPVRGDLDWAFWDPVFAELAGRARMQALVVLNRSPGWARAEVDCDNPLAPPRERADFGAFAAAVAHRYGDAIRYYQIWDEPNIGPHWGTRAVDPADYAGLLREGAVQVRAADSDAVIVLAALAPTTETGGANLSDVVYLDALYRLGARAWFDVPAVQPYGFSDPVAADPAPDALNFGRAALLREVMLDHDDAATPLWGVTFGWNALPPDWTGPPSPWGHVSETMQAAEAVAALGLTRTRWPWLGPLFWAAACPDRPADDPWLGFALCDRDGVPRPVWDALTAAADPSMLPPGWHAVDHPALGYSSGWRITPSAADPSASGDALTFQFYGSGLSLRVQGGPYWAYYRIWVDGRPANRLPRAGDDVAYLVLYDPLAETRTVPVVAGLPLGSHQVRLEAVGGWGQWALQGILVSAQDVGGLSWKAWSVLTGLALLLWVMLAWPWRRSMADWLGDQLTRVADGPDPIFWGCGIALALILVFSRWLAVDVVALVALVALAVLFLVRPDVSLPLIAASIPFWPTPKVLAGRQFSYYELLVWLAALALASRLLISALVRSDVSSQKGGDKSAQAESVTRRASGGSRIRLELPWIIERIRSDGRAKVDMRASAWRLSGLDWSVLALLGVGLAATLGAERFGVAAREYRTVFLTGGLFYWLLIGMPCRRQRSFNPWPTVTGLMLGMMVVSLIALWQLVTGQGRIDVEGVWRVRALYGSPNNLALVLDRAVPLALAIALFGRGGGRRWLYGLAGGVMLAACIATFSKGALLLGLPVGLTCVLVVGGWRTRQRWPLWLLAAGGAIGSVGLILLFQTPRFADLLNFQGGTSFFRIKLWQGAWHMALDHPWLGIGPDNFLYAYRTRYVLPEAWRELDLSHPHNLVLDLWTRLGLVGLVVGLYALAAGLRRGWRLIQARQAAIWPLALGLSAGLAATVAHGLIDNSIFLIDLMALFVLALGLLRRLDERTSVE